MTKNLRRWSLDSNKPFSLPLAADARLTTTDYLDDQAWELSLGAVDSPALVLQTRYGGRVGLASLLPMWFHDGRTIYQAQAYSMPPIITAFAPSYLRVQASLTPNLALQAEYWAMDSRSVGARFTLANAHTNPVTIRLDLFGHLGAQGKEQPVRILTLADKTSVLHFESAGNLNPVIVLESGSAEQPGSSKVGRELTIGSRKKIAVRWVHAGLPDARESLALAQRWLAQDWDDAFKHITQGTAFLPEFETGDENLDLALAISVQQLTLAYLKPTASLPNGSFVAERDSGTGFSPRGDGSDHRRAWSGQTPTTAYLAALGMAPMNPAMAQGVIRNYLAVQQNDGWIDWKPGLAGQRQGILCLPILARLAWGIFQYTEDTAFLKDVFPGLLRFFERWLALDADQDGLPEWQSENQTGYVFSPTFAIGQSWGHNADIRFFETPDILAYLLSEAISLRAIAYFLHNSSAETQLTGRIQALQNALDQLWQGSRYGYRDRSTHQTAASISILNSGRGDEEHILGQQVSPASRLIVRVEGGVDHTPSLTMHLQGLSEGGTPIAEKVDFKAFMWQRNRGVYTTEQIFSQIDRIRFDGLSRVYHVSVYTPDMTRLDISTLLPLWSVGLVPERTEAVIQLLSDSKHFWRPNGVTMCSAQDPNFDPANGEGSGGIWPFWATLLGEGLIEAGYLDKAADLLKRLLNVQVETLKQKRHFTEFYHSDELTGLGEHGHLSGIIPLHLFLRVIGVRIISGGKVWTGGAFAWGQPITVTQHGVVVQRSAEGTSVTFPSGHQVKLAANAEWQEVLDPNPTLLTPLKPFEMKSPKKPKSKSPKKADNES
jgi:hypothetical protein